MPDGGVPKEIRDKIEMVERCGLGEPSPSPTFEPSPHPSSSARPSSMPAGFSSALVETWYQIDGGDITNLTPTQSDSPDETATLTDALKIVDTGRSRAFGSRITTFITPAVTGKYRFSLMGDDWAMLYLSTDIDPSNKQRIVSSEDLVTAQSDPIPLVGGRSYYLEGLYTNSIGDDHFVVAWSIQALRPAVIAGKYFSMYPPPQPQESI